MSIVIDTPYRSTRGRKPSRPAFYFALHNDDDGGTSVVDRFGNAAALALQGTLGASWTAARGYWRPNGTDQHAITGTTNEYAAQTVIAPAVLTPGQALLVAWRIRWPATKVSSTESVLQIGRNNANSAWLQARHAVGGPMGIALFGVGASGSSSTTFGSSSLYLTATDHVCMLHVEAIASGVRVNAFLDGVAVGSQSDLLWTANGGAVPSVNTFAMPDGITVAALRSGSNPASPAWSQRLGSSQTADLSWICAVNLAAANLSLAGSIALELHQYPRHIGEILASF
jgi:hypothetical protein